MGGIVPSPPASAQVRHLRLVDPIPVDQGVGAAALPRTGSRSPRSAVSRTRAARTGPDVTTNTHLYQPATDRPWEDPESRLFLWVTEMTGAGCSERTIREWVQIVTRAARYTGREPEEMASTEISAWLASLRGRDGGPARAGTKAAYVVALRAWHLWLVRHNVRPDNPMDKLARIRVPRREPRPSTERDLERLLQSRMRARTRVMIHLAVYQGLRVHEVAKVRGEDFDLANGRMRVVGKGGVEAEIALHDVVARDAEVMPERGWWFPSTKGTGPVRRDSVSTVISHAMRRAGVRGTAHRLRHWYGTTLVETGTDVRVAQTLMRHGNLATTALYVKVNAHQQRDAVDRLPTVREHRIA